MICKQCWSAVFFFLSFLFFKLRTVCFLFLFFFFIPAIFKTRWCDTDLFSVGFCSLSVIASLDSKARCEQMF